MLCIGNDFYFFYFFNRKLKYRNVILFVLGFIVGVIYGCFFGLGLGRVGVDYIRRYGELVSVFKGFIDFEVFRCY